eukprot:jgi/Astpho2/7526/fgenesh1_pg.00114_%23_106_t
MADTAHTGECQNRSAAPSPDLTERRGSQDGVKQSTARRGSIASKAVPNSQEYCEGDAIVDGPVCMYKPPPKSGRADLAPLLQTDMGKWLKSHGKSVRVSMTSALKQQMQECFRMMDVNNSGGVDPHELGSAFRMLDIQQMLGIQASEREVQEVCATAGHNGELNYLDFVGDPQHGAEIIRKITGKAAEEAKAEGDASSTEKPAAPETVLEQVVSGLNEEDLAAIGEQPFLRLCASPATPRPACWPHLSLPVLYCIFRLVQALCSQMGRSTTENTPVRQILFGATCHALHQMPMAL